MSGQLQPAAAGQEHFDCSHIVFLALLSDESSQSAPVFTIEITPLADIAAYPAPEMKRVGAGITIGGLGNFKGFGERPFDLAVKPVLDGHVEETR